MLTASKLEELKLKITATVDRLNEIYRFNLKYPEYFWDVKGTTAGVAKSRTKTVHFNKILALENWKEFIEVTVPHEICHLGVFLLTEKNGKRKYPPPHGATWKLMMYEVGANSSTTHKFDTTNVKKATKSFIYNCKCGELEVSSTIHNKIKNGAIYQCKKCKNQLKDGIMKLTKKFSKSSPNNTLRSLDEHY